MAGGPGSRRGRRGREVPMELRELAPRHHAGGWRGALLIDDELSNVGWRACLVLDISKVGTGLKFRDHRTTSLIGHNVSVEFPADGYSVTVRLDGVIRNALRLTYSVVRVGVEFTKLSSSEQAVATVLSALTDLEPVSPA
ncbi:MAG TPA: PilZ domain-containing protein [Acidimicrobiales bacterium]